MTNISLCPIKSFDEERYLKFNPDVKNAVTKGELLSGLSHFISHGYYESRDGGPKELEQCIKNLLDNSKETALPPTHLRIRVHNTDVSTYNTIGRLVSVDLYSALKKYDFNPSVDSRILDFGCGPGRVINCFHYLYENCKFFGTDIDEEAIAWCQSNLSRVGEFSANKHTPPFHYPEQYFDFIYSISVFTHLPEDLQFSWLEELHRVTKKNGLLFLSIHDERLIPDEFTDLKQQIKESGFYYAFDPYGGNKERGLPEFYQTTFHTESYIRSVWGRFFQIEGIIKQGITNHQDLVVCRKK